MNGQSKLLSRVKRRASPLLFLVLLGIIASVGGVVPSLQSSKHLTERESLTARQALRVQSVRLQEVDHYCVERSYLGVIESTRQSSLSFELAGRVIQVLVDEGHVVLQGQLLAELDTQILESERRSLAAQVAAAKAHLDELIAGPRKEVIEAARAEVARWKAERDLAAVTKQRQDRLVQSNAGSLQEFDEAIFRERAIEAQHAASASRLAELVTGTRPEQIASQRAVWRRLMAEQESVELRIEKSRLIAPYDGIVSKRYLDEGTVLQASQVVLEVYDHRNLEARIGLPADVARSFDSSARHHLEVQGGKLMGAFKAIRPAKNPTTRAVDVMFSLSPDATAPLTGEIVELRIERSMQRDGFWIPADALVENYRGLWGCYAVVSTNGQQVAKMREIDLVHQVDGMAFVSGAIEAGEDVIVTGVHRLVANQIVCSTARGDAAATKFAKR